jgi:hypothetical protein
LEKILINPLQEQLLACLQNDWGSYLPRFERFSAEQQVAFLKKQGYARFGDLLAHVIAWWQEAFPAIENMLEDPAYRSPDVDVNAFNAQAVANFSELDEPAIILSFETLRAAWLDLVSALPDEAFQDPRICHRLHIEIIGHFHEHAQ